MNCHISLRNGVVYMPTMGKMGKGFYRGVEPVDVVPVKNTEALHQALKATIARGNPAVPQPRRRDDWPPPAVLKYAGVKSWPAFERGRQVWNLEENDGIYRIAGNTKGIWVGGSSGANNKFSAWHFSGGGHRSHDRDLAGRGSALIKGMSFLGRYCFRSSNRMSSVVSLPDLIRQSMRPTSIYAEVLSYSDAQHGCRGQARA